MITGDEPVRDARFRIDRALGRGANGVVYLAHDLKRGTPVAIKALTTVQPGSLYRFKQEFRSLAGLRHPNLVQLHELLADGDRWFFTMEPVDGVDFLRYVTASQPPLASADLPIGAGGLDALDTREIPVQRRAGSADAGRLRAALVQLLDGVLALHASGHLHRDLKPSNVMVTRDGRVVVLDFGLAKEMTPDGRVQSVHLVGTPVYMSPEQCAGAPLTTASDAYAIGLMTFEALAGQLPFRGSFVNMLKEKARWQPSDRDFPVDTPPDLAAVCRRLVALDPADRLPLAQARAWLGLSRPVAATTASSPAPAVFVGRAGELDRLHEAMAAVRAGAVIVFVHGSSGMGKTTLIRQFLNALRVAVSGSAILRARCYEQESVPYKGLDGLIDALVHHVRGLPPIERQRILPRDLHMLERLFPVMAEIGDDRPSWRQADITDPVEVRRRGGRALRDLLSRLADLRRLVLFVDDLQWGDFDSARLIDEILQPPDAPALLLIAAYRTEEADSSPCVRELRRFARDTPDLDVRDVPLEGLSFEESRALAHALSAGHDWRDDDAREVAREGEGVPFFIHELVRHWLDAGVTPGRSPEPAAGTVDELVASRMLQIDPECRELLELLAVCGQPLAWDVLVDAAAIDRHAAALDRLRDRRLVRSRRTGDVEELEIYHARMVKGVLRGVPAGRLAERHRALAQAFERSGHADPETLSVHYHEAGERMRAAEFAVAAAGQAWKALAFNRAADLYARALDEFRQEQAESPQMRTVRLALGDALASAGRGEEAAREFVTLAAKADPAERLQFLQRAMGQFFRTGRFDEGLATLRLILPSLRLQWPETSRNALIQLLWRQLQLRWRGLAFEERRESAAADQLVRIDACWSIATGLSVVDTLRGRLFQTRGLLWALDAGEPTRITRAIALEAAFSALSGVASRARTEALFERARELADRAHSPEASGLVMVARGIAHHIFGEFRRAVETLTEAEQMLAERCSDVAQELDNARVFGLLSLDYLGELAEIRARLPALLYDAEQRGDLYAKAMLTLRQCLIQIADDRPELARQMATDAAARWSRAGFHATHYAELLRKTEADLYLGRGAQALAGMEAGFVPLRRAHYLRNRFVLIDITHLRARVRLAAAVEGGQQRQMLADAERMARTMEHQKTRWGDALALLVRAGVAATRGHAPRCGLLLETAERGLADAEMRLFLAAARRRRGELAGGAAGAALVDAADAWMRTQGIVSPPRYTAMLVPGRFGPARHAAAASA